MQFAESNSPMTLRCTKKVSKEERDTELGQGVSDHML